MPGAFLGWRDGATLRYDNHASRRTAVHADAASDCWRPRDTPRPPPRSGGGAGTSWRPAALLVQPQPASRAASWWTASRLRGQRSPGPVAAYLAEQSRTQANSRIRRPFPPKPPTLDPPRPRREPPGTRSAIDRMCHPRHKESVHGRPSNPSPPDTIGAQGGAPKRGRLRAITRFWEPPHGRRQSEIRARAA